MDEHYHDLARLARDDPGFRNRILQASQDLNTSKGTDASKAIHKVLKASHYNLGFLLPYLFPNFMGPKEPLSLSRRPFAFPIFAPLLYGFLVLKGSRQISKSTNLVAKQLAVTNLFNTVSVYMAPHTEHIRTYSNKLAEMYRNFRYAHPGKGMKNNQYYKEFASGGRIEIYRVLTSAAHMRGKTADELDFDEYQLFDIRLEGEISQLQRTSERPTTIYSGTSTTIDSPLEIRYQQSSGGVWMMRSPNGKDYIDCSDPKLVIKMIRKEGLTCPYTDRLIQDPLDGIWEHARPHLARDKNLLGLHIPQFLIPDFLTPQEWPKIFNYLRDYGDTRTLQEVGGISVEQGDREITMRDLQEMCDLPFADQEEIQKWAKVKPRYKVIISGCDWGGSDYQMARGAKTSYTVHVVIGVYGDGKIDILHMQRHSGMEYDEIASKIMKKHLELGGTAIASDYGAGYAYNTFLHRDPRVTPTKHFVWEYNAPYTAMIKKPQYQQFPTHFMLNKTESITQVLEALKKKRIRCFSWATAQPLLGDILNSFRVHAETRHGRQYFLHIRNPAKPDDTLHALNFAYVLARLILKEPMFDDPALRDYVMGALGQNVGSVNTNMQNFQNLVVSG